MEGGGERGNVKKREMRGFLQQPSSRTRNENEGSERSILFH